MKAYKGFNNKLQCTLTEDITFQYEVGKTYETDEVNLCNTRFHACEYPLDVFSYYPPAKSRFCEVELFEVDGKKDNDSKIAGKKIEIKAEIGLKGLVEAAVNFTFDKVDWNNLDEKSSATGYQGAASATGDWGAASATGYQGAASATGIRGAASATGYQGAASATGIRGAASATGDQGAASATGEQCIALAAGYKSKASGTVGNWLVLTERNNKGDILDIKVVKVDGKTIKENTFYTLEDGKICVTG